MDRTESGFGARRVRETGEGLDCPTGGGGCFAVRTARGVRYTRRGRSACSAQGRVVNANGGLVLCGAGRAVRVSPRMGAPIPER